MTRTAPPASGPLDVLEVGRRGPSRRTVLLVVVPLVVVLATGLLVDQRARAAETSRLEACAARTHAAIQLASERMSGILNYVRPVWAYATPPRVERSLQGMVSEAARGAGPPLLRVRRDCAAVEVMALHSRLRGRQAACVGLLDAYVQFLRAIAGDGDRASGEWPANDERAC
ncbi:MAG: hypothetical protein QOK15_2989 [Nocardioidaceae bacterium]|nr:hypothetical protein [Nocardioidaceae bacterium]